MGYLGKVASRTALGLGIATTMFCGSIGYSVHEHTTMKQNLKDSVESALPAVTQRVNEVTNTRGSLSVGYISEDRNIAGQARGLDAEFTGSDSMYINTNTALPMFRKDNYTWPRRIWRNMLFQPGPQSTVLGTMYHEASHVRFGQISDTLSQSNLSVVIRADKPEMTVLNEGTATWLETKLGEYPEPNPKDRVGADSLHYKVIDNDPEIYHGGYNMVKPVLDSLGYRKGVKAMMTNPLPTPEELQHPGHYHDRILQNTE